VLSRFDGRNAIGLRVSSNHSRCSAYRDDRRQPGICICRWIAGGATAFAAASRIFASWHCRRPVHPCFVADAKLAPQLAEIGVILLMFGVGTHFSIRDLFAVRGVALLGAVTQIVVATALGAGVASLWGWSLDAGIIFGWSLSVASTVVLLRALEDREMIKSSDGRIAIGWLVVEDLLMVLTLVLLPALAGVIGGQAPNNVDNTSVWWALGITIGKVVLFIGLMLIGGVRFFPGFYRAWSGPARANCSRLP